MRGETLAWVQMGRGRTQQQASAKVTERHQTDKSHPTIVQGWNEQRRLGSREPAGSQDESEEYLEDRTGRPWSLTRSLLEQN